MKNKPTKKAKKPAKAKAESGTKRKNNLKHISSSQRPVKAAPAVPQTKKGKKEDMDRKADKLIVKGKERGFVTYDEILKEFPAIEEDIVFLEELYEKFSVAGIDVLEGGGLLEINVEELAPKKSYYGGGD